MSSEIENEVLTELKHVAKPLIELGLYDSTREFISDITKEFINHKIEIYKEQRQSPLPFVSGGACSVRSKGNWLIRRH